MLNGSKPGKHIAPGDSVDIPLIQRVFHPTDFSEASHVAFAHAMVIALLSKATLTILHVSGGEDSSWTDFPGVRHILERWGLLPQNSERADVLKLGINVQKVQMTHEDPVESIRTYLEEHGTDLVVLATDQQKGELQWFRRSVAADVARQSREMTLFVPKGSPGFVAAEDGTISLRNILIPVAQAPSAQAAVHAAVRLVSGLNCGSGTATLLHVGEEIMPLVACPEGAGWDWNHMTKGGEFSEVVNQVAGDIEADLIVMTTERHNEILDAIRGSHADQVLRECRCPLFVIPIHAWLSTVL